MMRARARLPWRIGPLRRLGRSTVLVASVLLLACSMHATAPEPPAPEPQRDVVVVTLNLWHDKADWPTRQAHIASTLRALQPDVIVLQEVLQHASLPNQAQTLAAALGYRHVFASVDAPDAVRRYGNAILTRHRILAEDTRSLQPADDYRIALHVRIALDDGTPLDVYAAHLHHTPEGGDIRRQQLDDLLAFIDATNRGAASIVAGDFNAAADAPELSALRARFRDAYGLVHPQAAADAPGHSTLNPAFHAPQRIDHVLFDARTLAVEHAKRVFDAPMPDGAWASDHVGVVVSLRFAPSTVQARPN